MGAGGGCPSASTSIECATGGSLLRPQRGHNILLDLCHVVGVGCSVMRACCHGSLHVQPPGLRVAVRGLHFWPALVGYFFLRVRHVCVLSVASCSSFNVCMLASMRVIFVIQGASDGVGESACNATGLNAPHCSKEEYCFVVACVGLNARLTGIEHTSRLPVPTADVGVIQVLIEFSVCFQHRLKSLMLCTANKLRGLILQKRSTSVPCCCNLGERTVAKSVARLIRVYAA